MRRVAWIVALAVWGAGCSDAGYVDATAEAPAQELMRAEPVGESAVFAPPAASADASMMGGVKAVGSEGAGGQPAEPVPAALPRKIIYTADVALVVEDFPTVEAAVTRLVQQYQGYIAEMTLMGSPGSNRSARWKLRVPVSAFDSFLADIGKLGETEKQSRGSSDVTEEFYDLEARIKNKKVEEARLIRILEEITGKIEEVLRVEAELSRVRGEIERMEGRIRLLENLTSMTTITLNVRERERFEPPPPVAASYPTRLARAFEASWKGLILFIESVTIGLANNWTLLVFGLIPGLLIAWLVSRYLVRNAGRLAQRLWNTLNMRLTPPPPPPTT